MLRRRQWAQLWQLSQTLEFSSTSRSNALAFQWRRAVSLRRKKGEYGWNSIRLQSPTCGFATLSVDKNRTITIKKVSSTDEGIACHFERRPLITLDRDDPSRAIRLNPEKFMEAESTLFSRVSTERHTAMVVAWHFRGLRRRSRRNRTTNTETAVSTYNNSSTYVY